MSHIAKRLLAVLLAVSLLPVSALGTSEAPQQADAPSVAFWARSQFSETVTVTGSVVVEQEVLLTDQAVLMLDGGHLVIGKDAVFTGDIVIAGNNAVLDIAGELRGNVRVTAAKAQVKVSGSLRGQLALDGLAHIRNADAWVDVSVEKSGYVKTITLAGVGTAMISGTVDLVDTDPANQIRMETLGGTVGTLYARSDIQYNFVNAHVGTIYMDCLLRSIEDESGLHNVALWEASHADKIIVDVGHVHASNGSSIGTVYLYGKGSIHLDQGYVRDGETWPTGHALELASAGKVIQIGKHVGCSNNGYIGFHYVEDGYTRNGGYTETLVAVRSNVDSYAGLSLGEDNAVYLFSTFFDKHYGTLISLDSTLSMNEETIIGKLFADGGDLGEFPAMAEAVVLDASGKGPRGFITGEARVGTLVSTDKVDLQINAENITRGILPRGETIGEFIPRAAGQKPRTFAAGGNTPEKATSLSDGEHWVKATDGSQWYTVPADAYTALDLTVDAYGGYGFAIIETPDGDYRFLDGTDGAQTVSLMNEKAGAYAIRLISPAGTEGFILRLKTEAPLRIDYTLAERAPTVHDEKPELTQGDIRDYTLTVYDETTGKEIAVTATADMLLAMPDAVAPGSTLRLSLKKKDGSIEPYTATVILNDRRYASAALEGTSRGQYAATLQDTYRAHLYLYDGNGEFVREIFQKGGEYSTGGLAEGAYQVAMIRAGAGGWKMLHAGQFAENGLLEGEHYLLDSFTVQNGVIIRRGNVSVPDEPALQSEWFVAEETGYQARVPSVVVGGLAMMAMDWSLAREDMTDVCAEIAFLKGAKYVPGSAAIDGLAVDAAWENGVLRVPLGKQSGKLLFYVEGDGTADALVSNASVTFAAGGQAYAQYVGSAQTRIVPLSIHGPSLASESSVTVYGYTSPYEVAYIYDNGALAGTAVSDAKGLWSAHVPISADPLHSLTVGTGEDGVQSAPIEIRRATGAPVLQQFTLHYVEHKVTKKISVEGELFGRSPIKFAYEPGTDLTFVLSVSNDQYVDTVTVVAEMNGQRETIPARRDSKTDEWVAVGRFTNDRMFAPDLFTVEYTFREDALDLAFQEPFLSVPLLNTLYEVSDLTGTLPLSRYYMASPTLQAADMGFGPGWQTGYAVYATAYEADGAQWLAVTSPTDMRIFSGAKGKYTEAAGYATAAVDSKGAITVTEATGAAMAFDPTGRLTAATDEYKRKMTLAYDEQGRLVSVTYGGETLRLSYTADGLIDTATVGDSTVQYRYTNGHLTAVSGPNGHESYAYDGLLTGQGRHPLISANGAGGVLGIRYDGEGMPIRVEQDGTAIDIAYADDAVTMRMDGSDIVFRLDAFGRCTRVEYAGGYEEKVPTEEGMLVRSVKADGRTVEVLYNQSVQPLSHKDGNGAVVRFAYDKAGNLSAVTDANGNKTEYTYDKAGNLTRITHADGSTEKYTYAEKDGAITGYTDRAGNKTAFSYDKQGNLIRAAYPGREETRYDYDEDGNLVRISAGENEVWVDDAQEDRLHYTFAGGKFIGFNWSDYHNGVYSHSDFGDHATTSEYDNTGLLSRIVDEHGEALVTYAYDEEGKLTRETRANGTYATYTYAGGWLAQLENHGADGSLHSYYAYGYDMSGNIVCYETLDGTWQYAYDAAGQLTRVEGPKGSVTEYAYDAAGNRVREVIDGVETRYEVNALNQYTRVGDTVYTYDKNGQLTRKEGPDGATEYVWDARGRLVSVDGGETRTENTYDVLGNRSAVTVNGQTTRYTVAPSALPFVLYSDAGDGETYYHYGDSGLVASAKDGQTLYYSFTPLGSVSEITDADGNVLRRYEYDAMGRVIGETAFAAEMMESGDALDADALDAMMVYAQAVEQAAQATAVNPFTYVGRYGIMDDGNGLWYMRARYTAQDVGRFVSPDPAGQGYDLNLYRYANNNSVWFYDLSGEKSTSGSYDFNGYYHPGREALSAGQMAGRSALGAALIAGGIYGVKSVPAIALSGFPQVAVAVGAISWVAIVGGGFLIASTPALGAPLPAPLGTPPSGKGTGPHNMGTSPGDTAVDPSGYVYETLPSNRIEGVTATVYYRDEEGRAIQWKAEEYGQENPQITDFLGQYAWYVPAGEWKVIYEKAGYEPLETAWLPVPPPQTEVNMALTSYAAPEVAHAALYGDGAEITFSKYMDIDSVARGASLARTDGAQIPVTVTPLNAEPVAGNEETLLASRFRLSFAGDTPDAATLTVSQDAVSYAGVPAKACQVSLIRAWHLEGLGLETEYALTPQGTHQIALHAAGEGHFEQLSLSATVNTGADVTVVSVAPFDAEGNATITVATGNAGKATILFAEATTGLTWTALLTVQPEGSEFLYQATINTKGDDGVRLWENTDKKKVIVTIRKGKTVDVLEEMEDGWARIRFEDSEGVVEARYLLPVE